MHAVEDVSLTVNRGETLGIVGESGCGKSTTARLIVRLLDPTAGAIRFDGQDISTLSQRAAPAAAARDADHLPGSLLVAQPAQDASARSSASRSRSITDRGRRKARVQELLARVGLSPEHYNRYPHEFSGGQRQRIGIARALALQPKLIVCDEPVSALDVSVQAQILNLLKSLQAEFDLTYVFISHDLSVIRQVSDRIAVMYLGRVVELGDSELLYEHPRHPYTAALLSAVPRPDAERGGRARSGSCSAATSPRRSTRRRPASSTRAARAVQPAAATSRRRSCAGSSGDHWAACHFPVERWPMTAEELRRPGAAPVGAEH